MDKVEKIEDFLSRVQGLVDNAKKRGHIIVRVEDLENTFPELRKSNDEEKPNGGIVLEDFNGGDGFYKINLAYLSKEQVEEIENTVKKWHHKPIESEDERMWKLIKKYVHYNISDMALNADRITREQLESWLEKQGKHLTNYDEAEKEKSDFVGDGFIECHADFLDFKEGNTYWLEYIGDDKYNVRSDNLLGKTYHITPCQLYTIFKKLTWLEKQAISSKKDVDDAYLKGVTDTKNEIEKQYEANYQIRKDIATFLFNYKGDIKDRSKWMNYLGIKVSFVEKQGEKPKGKSAFEAINEEKVDNQNCVKSTDKVEPKFNVGDWVVDNCSCVWKIEGILNQFYILECPEGGESRPTIEWVDRNFHLWTIQDAKDGDVLSANWREGSNFWERIIIFNKYHSKDVKGLINAPYVEGYGNTFKNGKLIPCAKVPYYSTWTDKLYPATKEQRDLLFQTMKEVGYEWDADKKELKKEEVK